MANDRYKLVLFNDGEGLEYVDFNDAQNRLLARYDDRLASLLGDINNGVDPALLHVDGAVNSLQSDQIYTWTGSDALIKEGSTNTRVSLSGGTIFQWTEAGEDGDTPILMAYQMNQDDTPDLLIAAGDAANPRIDIVQCKLEWEDGAPTARDFKDAVTGALSSETPNKERRVKATFSIKQGVAAATPAYPSPDAGYGIVASLRVPALWANGFVFDVSAPGTNAALYQNTWPMRQRAITMCPHEYDFDFATNWQRSTGLARAIGGAGSDLRIWCPVAEPHVRITGIDIVGRFLTSSAVNLQVYTWSYAGGYVPIGIQASVLTADLSNPGATDRSMFARAGKIADGSTNSNPASAGSHIGNAWWAVGGRSGAAKRKIYAAGAAAVNAVWFDRAALSIDGGQNSEIAAVTWYLAG